MSGRSCNLSKQNVGDTLFDILTIVISLSDLITDLLILNSYYTNGYYTFFYLSLSVVILAQLSYCWAFTVLFSENDDSICVQVCTFITCLMFSPLLSIIMYLARDTENEFTKKILHDTCGLRTETYQSSNNKSLKFNVKNDG